MSRTIQIVPKEHTADFAVQIMAGRREDLIIGSLQALEERMGITVLSDSKVHFPGQIESHSGNELDRIVNLLNDWLYHVQTSNLLPVQAIVTWKEKTVILSWQWQQRLDPESYETEIKAVTYHGASIERPKSHDGMWSLSWIADL